MLGILCACLGQISRAEEHTKETVMSINRPLQVRDILLAPGQYVFRLTKPDVDHSVVSIYNAQTNRLERTIIGFARVSAHGRRQARVYGFPTPGRAACQVANLVLPRREFRVEFWRQVKSVEQHRNPIQRAARQILARPVMVRRHAKRVKPQRR
jgi:hypothetical protein